MPGAASIAPSAEWYHFRAYITLVLAQPARKGRTSWITSVLHFRRSWPHSSIWATGSCLARAAGRGRDNHGAVQPLGAWWTDAAGRMNIERIGHP